jgi:hypothetical protein
VVGVLDQELTLEECPPPLKRFMIELASIGKLAKEMEEEDTKIAMERLARGEEVSIPRIERVRELLVKGVGSGARSGTLLSRSEQDERRRSVEGRAVGFANRVNALALGISKLQPFKERQSEVFKVLAGIGW